MLWWCSLSPNLYSWLVRSYFVQFPQVNHAKFQQVICNSSGSYANSLYWDFCIFVLFFPNSSRFFPPQCNKNNSIFSNMKPARLCLVWCPPARPKNVDKCKDGECDITIGTDKNEDYATKIMAGRGRVKNG